jgi:hypothetical protein
MSRARWAALVVVVFPMIVLARRCPEWFELQQQQARRERLSRMREDSVAARADTLYARGRAVGRAGDEAACFDAHTDSMRAMSEEAAMNSSDFLYGCLDSARRTPGFCQGVARLAYPGPGPEPTPRDVVAASDSFRLAHCAAHPADEGACAVQARVKQLYCHNEGAFSPDSLTRETWRSNSR